MTKRVEKGEAVEEGSLALPPALQCLSSQLVPDSAFVKWILESGTFSSQDPPVSHTLVSFKCHSVLKCHLLKEARTNCPLQNSTTLPPTLL